MPPKFASRYDDERLQRFPPFEFGFEFSSGKLTHRFWHLVGVMLIAERLIIERVGHLKGKIHVIEATTKFK